MGRSCRGLAAVSARGCAFCPCLRRTAPGCSWVAADMQRRPSPISLRRLAAATLAAALTLLACAAGTPAALPGANGRIAFVRTVAPGDTEVFAMDADGGGVTRLTDSP